MCNTFDCCQFADVYLRLQADGARDDGDRQTAGPSAGRSGRAGGETTQATPTKVSNAVILRIYRVAQKECNNFDR